MYGSKLGPEIVALSQIATGAAHAHLRMNAAGSASAWLQNWAWIPPDHSLISWTMDPSLASASTALTTAGTLYAHKLHIPEATTVTSILMHVITAGVTLTAGRCFAALYQNNTLLGVTADQSGTWNSTGLKTMNIAGGPVAVAAGDVVVGVWFNGTTGPAFLRGNINIPNMGIAAMSNYRFGIANTGLTTTAPNPIAATTASGFPHLIGLA